MLLLLWDNGDMQKVAELLVPDNGKCGTDIKQSCRKPTFTNAHFLGLRLRKSVKFAAHSLSLTLLGLMPETV